METFKKKLRIRIGLFAAVLLIFVFVLCYDQFGAPAAIKESSPFTFQCGLAASGSLVLVYMIAKYRRALSNEQKLQMLFHAENDERLKAIRAKAGVPMVLVLSLLLVLAGMIIGYFNETIFLVLISVALFQLLVSSITKFYYLRKM